MSARSDRCTAARDVTLPASVALHARPAAVFARAAAGFTSAIEVSNGTRFADAKSVLEVMALGIGGGSALRITAAGDDSEAAVAALADLVATLSE